MTAEVDPPTAAEIAEELIPRWACEKAVAAARAAERVKAWNEALEVASSGWSVNGKMVFLKLDAVEQLKSLMRPEAQPVERSEGEL